MCLGEITAHKAKSSSKTCQRFAPKWSLLLVPWKSQILQSLSYPFPGSYPCTQRIPPPFTPRQSKVFRYFLNSLKHLLMNSLCTSMGGNGCLGVTGIWAPSQALRMRNASRTSVLETTKPSTPWGLNSTKCTLWLLCTCSSGPRTFDSSCGKQREF